jgi:hypothetical protein
MPKHDGHLELLRSLRIYVDWNSPGIYCVYFTLFFKVIKGKKVYGLNGPNVFTEFIVCAKDHGLHCQKHQTAKFLLLLWLCTHGLEVENSKKKLRSKHMITACRCMFTGKHSPCFFAVGSYG